MMSRVTVYFAPGQPSFDWARQSLTACFFTLDDPIYDPDSTSQQQKEKNSYQFKKEVCFDLLNTRGGVQSTGSREVWGLLFLSLMFDLPLISLPLMGFNLSLWSLFFLCRGEKPTSAHPRHSPPFLAAFPLVFTAAPKVLEPLQQDPPPRPHHQNCHLPD